MHVLAGKQVELLLGTVDHLQHSGWVHQSISPAIQGGYAQKSEEDSFHPLVEEVEDVEVAARKAKTYMNYSMLKCCTNNTLANNCI